MNSYIGPTQLHARNQQSTQQHVINIGEKHVYQQCIMYGGFAQAGSLRAAKTENEERRATLEQIGISSLKTLFGSEQTR